MESRLLKRPMRVQLPPPAVNARLTSINGLNRTSETNQAGDCVEPLTCLANRFPKTIKSPVACAPPCFLLGFGIAHVNLLKIICDQLRITNLIL
jgi:hypothetical protein